MILRPPTREECQMVREWRNAPDVLPMLRTKEPLTVEQQDAFYDDVVCNPKSEHEYFALEQCGQFIGMGGLTHLDRTFGEAEISLILGPEFRGKGFGSLAVDALLEQARTFGLSAVVGECYAQGNQRFWIRKLIGDPRVLWEWKDNGTLAWRWTL